MNVIRIVVETLSTVGVGMAVMDGDPCWKLSTGVLDRVSPRKYLRNSGIKTATYDGPDPEESAEDLQAKQ